MRPVRTFFCCNGLRAVGAMRRVALLAIALLAVASAPAFAADAGLDFFEKKIRPVLIQHCYECHASTSRVLQAGLALDSRAGIRKGGDSGPAVVPGKPEDSLLISALKYEGLEMPPRGRLPDSVLADFVRWIEMGAPDPRDAPLTARKPANHYASLEEGRKFWAFRKPASTPAPPVHSTDWAWTTVDRFLLAKLEANGLQPAPDAEPADLIRRLSFDLIGLPPTPEQVDAFVRDPSRAHYARIVDELLASPHFGERWGRHWLDVARFAESSGGGRSLVFPDAWRYRDYVIRSFNEDKPYDRFLMEQIAGDLLPAGTPQEREDQIVALGFLALGPTNYEAQDKDVLELDVIDEQLDTLGRVVMGMTIGCARCHDHKFDPIPTRDYYALAGILKSTQTLIHENVSRWVDVPLPMPPEQETAIARHEAAVSALRQRIDRAKAAAGKATSIASGAVKPRELPGIVLDDSAAKRVGAWKPSTYTGVFIGDGFLYDERQTAGEKTLTFVPEFPAEGRYEVRLAYVAHSNRATNVPVTILHAEGEKSLQVDLRAAPPVEGRFVSLGTYRFDRNGQWFVLISNMGTNGHVAVDAVQFLPESLKGEPEMPAVAELPVHAAAAVEDVKELEAQLKKLAAQAPARPTSMGVRELPNAADTYICIRGNRTNKGEVVPRGFLRVTLSTEQESAPPESWRIPNDQSGRLQLARWLADADHPLTARVMVNRIWQHLFGTGIVRTTDIFGTTGELPSHPELLDHLALQFSSPADGQDRWSMKAMIRSLVLTHAYRMSSEVPVTAGSETDGAAQPSAAALASARDPENRWLWRQNRRRLQAECLRDAMLVASGRLDRTMGGPVLKLGPEGEYGYQFTDLRRSVYTPILRNRLHELFEVFDFADPNLVAGRRNVSTVAPQALFLMNSPFVMNEADEAAKAALARTDLDDEARLVSAYRTALGRLPSGRERSIAMAFLSESGESAEARRKAWARVYQALFASLDFRFVR